jgi:nitrogen fixation protein FixH
VSHPLGRAPEQRISLLPVAPGLYRARNPSPAGRWIIRLGVREGGHEARFLTEVKQ